MTRGAMVRKRSHTTAWRATEWTDRIRGVPFADHISPPIPSLASKDVQGYTDGQLKWILDYGIKPSGMPGSKGMLSDDELWSIVVYIRHLPPAGSQGVPDIYTH